MMERILITRHSIETYIIIACINCPPQAVLEPK